MISHVTTDCSDEFPQEKEKNWPVSQAQASNAQETVRKSVQQSQDPTLNNTDLGDLEGILVYSWRINSNNGQAESA